MGHASTLLFDPNGSCVSSVEGTIVANGPGQPSSFYVGAGYAPIIYDGYGLPVWTPPALPTSTQSLNWATGQPFQYKGRYGYYTDSASGLIYCTHRYYDPNVGRWTERDPSGLDGGVNVYGYVHGDPVDGADPDGLQEPALDSVDATANNLIRESLQNPREAIKQLLEKMEEAPNAHDRGISKSALRQILQRGNGQYTRGFSHSLKHAQEFFGKRIIGSEEAEQWKSIVDYVSRSKSMFESTTGGQRVIGIISRYKNANMVVKYFVDGDRAGQMATMFRVNDQTAQTIYQAVSIFGR